MAPVESALPRLFLLGSLASGAEGLLGPVVPSKPSGGQSAGRGGLISRLFSGRMVTDVQLAIFANMLGVSLFLLVVLYHYVAVNNPKKQE